MQFLNKKRPVAKPEHRLTAGFRPFNFQRRPLPRSLRKSLCKFLSIARSNPVQPSQTMPIGVATACHHNIPYHTPPPQRRLRPPIRHSSFAPIRPSDLTLRAPMAKSVFHPCPSVAQRPHPSLPSTLSFNLSLTSDILSSACPLF